ncbi:FBOX protein [Steccherinum ochraceum]|uniref:FBOX protein n=1 Tax=Steccherinum ochraceum TaxID=92696 RepID=A0A4R0RGM8_9APHY|nr:FBOX protein [Steccherinum ochraceum]
MPSHGHAEPNSQTEMLSRPKVQSHNLSSLALEELMHILAFLPGNDVISLLSTCRSYRLLVSKESIWRDQCSKYGVHDLNAFRLEPGRTFFQIYTELLHTYGPLLGIWASDNPFMGNVMEFRLVTYPESEHIGWDGIIGEVWNFRPRSLGISGEPALPDYYQFMIVRLSQERDALETIMDDSVESRRFAASLRLCYSLISPLSGGISRASAFSPKDGKAIALISPHHRAYAISSNHLDHNSQRPTLHPPFPPVPLQKTWVDESRFPPVQPRNQDILPDETSLLSKIPLDMAYPPVYYTVPSQSELSLHSITILPPHYREPEWHTLISPRPPYTAVVPLRVVLPFGLDANYDDLEITRYFPLPSSSIQPAGPSESTSPWKPQSLEGLWLGTCYSPMTEVFDLKWNEADGEVQAWKITGNTRIPRGALAWSFKPALAMPPSEFDGLLLDMELGLDALALEQCKVFTGSGVTAREGFLWVVLLSAPLYASTIHRASFSDATVVTLQLRVVLVDQNEICIRWMYDDGEYDDLIYCRYPQRDIKSEVFPLLGHIPGVRRSMMWS